MPNRCAGDRVPRPRRTGLVKQDVVSPSARRPWPGQRSGCRGWAQRTCRCRVLPAGRMTQQVQVDDHVAVTGVRRGRRPSACPTDTGHRRRHRRSRPTAGRTGPAYSSRRQTSTGGSPATELPRPGSSDLTVGTAAELEVREWRSQEPVVPRNADWRAKVNDASRTNERPRRVTPITHRTAADPPTNTPSWSAGGELFDADERDVEGERSRSERCERFGILIMFGVEIPTTRTRCP